MKKLAKYSLSSLLLSLLITACSQTNNDSKDWAASFIVWKGNKYVVTTETLTDEELREQVGEVTFYSDNEFHVSSEEENKIFSNEFQEGSEVYSIRDVEQDVALAVRNNDTITKVTFDGRYGE